MWQQGACTAFFKNFSIKNITFSLTREKGSLFDAHESAKLLNFHYWHIVFMLFHWKADHFWLPGPFWLGSKMLCLHSQSNNAASYCISQRMRFEIGLSSYIISVWCAILLALICGIFSTWYVLWLLHLNSPIAGLDTDTCYDLSTVVSLSHFTVNQFFYKMLIFSQDFVYYILFYLRYCMIGAT